jgi:type IV secretory pathway VirB2 component (pilin)
MDKIKGGSGGPDMGDLQETMDATVTHIVSFIRYGATIAAVVIVISIALSLFGGSGNTEIAMAIVKRRALYLVIALFVIFQAERLVSYFVNVFGGGSLL